MKIRIDIDCTPQEARASLGLPDLEPLQAEMVDRMRERMIAALDGMAPEALMKLWFSPDMQKMGLQGAEELQKAFWAQFMGGKARE